MRRSSQVNARCASLSGWRRFILMVLAKVRSIPDHNGVSRYELKHRVVAKSNLALRPLRRAVRAVGANRHRDEGGRSLERSLALLHIRCGEGVEAVTWGPAVPPPTAIGTLVIESAVVESANLHADATVEVCPTATSNDPVRGDRRPREINFAMRTVHRILLARPLPTSIGRSAGGRRN